MGPPQRRSHGKVAEVTDIRSKIDELIEESYLATLPEEAIRQDVLQFLDTCEKLVRTSDDEQGQQEMLRRLATFKELALRFDKASELIDQADQWAAWSQHDLIAHRAARMKLLVLNAVRAVDHSIAEQIEQHRFPKELPHRDPPKARPPRRVRPAASRSWFGPATTSALLRACYALLAGATLFLVGYRLLH